MLTADDFRDLALRLDGATEGSHMGHPDFRAGGRIFASLHANEETGTVKLTPDEQREMIRTYPRMFSPLRVRGVCRDGWLFGCTRPRKLRCEPLSCWRGKT
jgi:hypothetical protein